MIKDDEQTEDRFKDFECLDCKVNTHFNNEYYMVHKDLWYKAVPPVNDEEFFFHNGTFYRSNPDGMLCIGCLESRLGRELVARDFTTAPINYFPNQSVRLKNRLGRITRQ